MFVSALRPSISVVSRLFVFIFTAALLGSLFGCAGGGSGGSGGGSGTPTTPVPAITSISPTKLAAGVAQTTLTVSGTGFISSSTVEVGGTAEATTYVSATQLTATVPATQLVNGANLGVTVANGASSSGATVSLEVDNPAPVITSMSSTSAFAGTASAVITLTGTGFVPATVIDVNASARATTFINSTQVSVALPSTDFAAAGTLSLTAVNAAPGGGTSSAATVAVNNPPVDMITLSPSTLAVGSTTAATVTVTGTGFVAGSVVQVSGTARAATFVNNTTLTFVATVADQATAATLPVTVTNPAPGGGTSPVAALNIIVPLATPVITSVSPNSIVAGSPDTFLTIFGTGFTQNTVAQWNGANLTTTEGYNYNGTSYVLTLYATLPASYLTSTGTGSVTASTPNASPAVSNAESVSIVNPPAPVLTGIYPSGGAIGVATAVTLNGTGFTQNTTVALNGSTISSTFVNSTQITATFPASSLAIPGNENVTVSTPAPGGGVSAPQVYTTFVSLSNNDIVYNAVDGLLYASVPATAAGGMGNSVVGIDPNTGAIMRTIPVGTNPNKLALSTDGTQLFVGIDGAGAVAQVNLAQGTIVNQFALGGGPGLYNAPYTAAYLAAVPGLPNSVAVAPSGQYYYSGVGVIIYDSGVARTGGLATVPNGPLSFGSSASTLYVGGSYVDALTVGSTGVTNSAQLASVSYALTNLQYDNGELYLSNGQVLNVAAGALSGTFYSSATTPATGPIVSDSTLGKAFIALSYFSGGASVDIFDETSFSLLGSIPLNDLGTPGYSSSFRKIVRWGQNGIAVAAVPSAFTSNNQIYIFQSPLVKDVSASPADLSVSLTAPATTTTGTTVSYVANVTNAGPNAAVGATLSASLDPSLIINSVTASQGSCTTGVVFTCDLQGLANGATATVTVSATPTNSGTLAATTTITSSSYDPTASNNQATVSTTVTGSLYGAVPSIASISPNIVQAGSAAFTLTVNGTGFNAGSVVNLGSSAQTTTYVSPTQITAAVTADAIANYGWSAVTISNPAPGGGVSAISPLTVFSLVNVPAASILFDPYGQSLYATVPGSATGITGNSVVAINPFTAAVGTPVAVGSQPTVMAESGDGSDLYVSLSGSQSIAQYDLVHQNLLQTITIANQPTNYYGTAGATSMAVMPGTDTTLAVDFSGSDGIMDINGTVGTLRTNFASSNFPTFGDATHLYTYDNQSTGAEFYRYSIDANGLTLIDGTTLDGLGGFSGGFGASAGLIYGDSGGIINPNTTPPSQVQTLPLIDFYGSGDIGGGVSVVADPSLQKDFLMQQNDAGTWAYGLVRYDLKSYLPEATLVMPASASSVESTWTMLRFGQDGLALLSNDSFGVSPSVVQLLLLRGPFVAPQELGTATAASLASSSASTLTHNSGNTTLTLTGANFLPGVAVTWNGSYRTTTVVDATHVTVNIPASDLSAAGTASVVATNPGAPASSALTITIN